MAEEARAWFEAEGVEDDIYGGVLYFLGEHEEALRVYEALLAETPEDDSDLYPRLGMAGALAARLGDEDTAREYDARLEALEERRFSLGGPTANRAVIAVGLGELDRAVDLLEEAFELGMGYSLWLRHAPELAELQGHPAFERFMEPRG